MSRHAGQVTTRQALAGLGVTALVIALITGLSTVLLVPQDVLPPLEALGEEEPQTCQERLDRAAAGTVSSDDLVDCPRQFDGRQVRYRGEVVGAVLQRRERAWVQLNDDVYALDIGPLPAHRTAVGGNAGIPVSIPITAVADIDHVGGHNARGTVLDISGVFHRAHPEDRGGPAIQAVQVRVADAGAPVGHPVAWPRLVLAAVLLLATLALARHTWRVRHR